MNGGYEPQMRNEIKDPKSVDHLECYCTFNSCEQVDRSKLPIVVNCGDMKVGEVLEIYEDGLCRFRIDNKEIAEQMLSGQDVMVSIRS